MSEMKHTPITKQRSPWIPTRAGIEVIDGIDLHWYRREVSDGTLFAAVANEPQGWHLSISFRDKRDRLTRYPRWDEIAHAREELLPHELEFVMFLPREGEYVALHDTTFHLHEHPARSE